MVERVYKSKNSLTVSSFSLPPRVSAWLSENKRFLFRLGLGLVLLPVLVVLGALLFGLLKVFAAVVLFLVVTVLVIGFGLMVVAVIEDRLFAWKVSERDPQSPPSSPPGDDQVIDVVTLP
jgi:hypothetical protein